MRSPVNVSLFTLAGLVSCTPVKDPIHQVYQLEQFKTRTYAPSAHTLTVSQTTSVNGYRTEQMLYIQKPYTIMPFAKNAWQSPPADMLYALLTQSLQKSGFFKAVASGPYAEPSEYRLDTTILGIQQNFLQHPSVYEIKVQAVLNQVNQNHIMASKIFSYEVPCPSDTPYGGVIAANQATAVLTQEVTAFVIGSIKSNKTEQ